MLRLFAAVAVPPDIGEGLQRRQQGAPGARWRPLEALHITLRFFGEVREDVADDLDAELSAITAAPLDLMLEGVGAFGEGQHIHAIWAGVAESAGLRRLAARCETAARRAGLKAESRAYRPHVTLAYLTRPEPARVAAWVQGHNLLKSPPFTAREFGLYASRQGPDGSVYRLERAYRLGACPGTEHESGFQRLALWPTQKLSIGLLGGRSLTQPSASIRRPPSGETAMLGVGEKLPNFKVIGVKPKFNRHEENGESAFQDITNDSFPGKWKVIFFYPKDFTFVCPTEIVEFAKLNKDFEDRDTVVLGGSTDNEHSKLAWRREHPDLNSLPIWSFGDNSGKFARALGVLNEDEGVALRATFVVDPDNVIQHVYVTNLNVGRAPADTLRVLDALQTDELCPCNRQVGGETLAA